MRSHNPKYCEESGGKYIFSSEAKAFRSLNKYEDIKRVYHCPFCDEWHTTSQPTWNQDSKRENDEDISKTIQERLKFLKDKLDEE